MLTELATGMFGNKQEWFFAHPPEWTTRASCIGLWNVFDEPLVTDMAHIRRTCARCPVRADCTSDALASEVGVSGRERDGFRAGMTHWDRVRAHLAMPACPGCGLVKDRARGTGSCHECSLRGSRDGRGFAPAVRNRPKENVA